MKTNELKKGVRVLLRCGWEAVIADNAKGNTRVCTVYGDFTEMGSVYSHDIIARQVLDAEEVSDKKKIMYNGKVWIADIEYTESQLKCKDFSNAIGM